MTAYKTALFIIQHMLLFYVSRSLCAELLNSVTRLPPWGGVLGVHTCHVLELLHSRQYRWTDGLQVE